MASTQRVVITDDLDGSTDDVGAVWIGLDADLYEVDLSAQHRQQLMAVLGSFIAHARLIPRDDEPPRPRRPHEPPPAHYATKAVTQARTAPTPVGYEHPDYPWFPFAKTGVRLAAHVRVWAGEQGIPMPHRGTPRSVLLAYRRSEQTTENQDSGPTA